jgi:DNA modification methylase
MQIQWLKPEQVIPYARNPRNNAQAVSKVAASLKEYGWQQPIVVDKEYVIIVGHTRLLAAQQLGMEKVPVLIADNLTLGQAKAYRLADNRLHEEASWDNTLLGLELEELKAINYNLELTAFNEDELNQLLSMSVDNSQSDIDACPELEEYTPAISQLGDIWLLGEHRLMCGDSTQLEAVEKLIAGNLCDMVFTDPPYNVNYQGVCNSRQGILQDNMNISDFTQFLRDAFANMRMSIKQGASLYICHASRYQREFENALEANGISVRNQIIWAKQHFALSHSRYKFQHEPIFYGHVKGESDSWYGDNGQSTLWQVDKPNANPLHPTMKPIALIEKALENSSKAGDIILDLFGGSGSTLIACEKLGRKAYLMELDPKYVDVIIKRWQEYTGQSAILEATGREFNTYAAIHGDESLITHENNAKAIKREEETVAIPSITHMAA